MHINIKRTLDFFEESIGDLLVVFSVLLFFAGLLFMTSFYQIVSAFAMFFGVILLVSGFAIRLSGPLTLGKPSIGGVGAIMIYVGIMALGTTGIFALFTTPAGVRIRNVLWHGIYMGTEVTIDVAHPLSWLTIPLAVSGIVLLVIGLLIRIIDSW